MKSLDGGGLRDTPGELTLRRFRAGELPGEERIRIEQRLADSAELRARLRALDDEQEAFEREVPFAEFAGGVDRARRHPPVVRQRLPRGSFVALGAAAAAMALFVALPRSPTSRTKGGSQAAVSVRIGNVVTGAQRDARPDQIEVLVPGDRVRVGHHLEAARWLMVLSIDDAGVVTPLHPRQGQAVTVEATPQPSYLPDSIEFTAAGRERLVILVASKPFVASDGVQAAHSGYRRSGGDLAAVVVAQPEAGPPWQEFAYLFEKP